MTERRQGSNCNEQQQKQKKKKKSRKCIVATESEYLALHL